MVIPDSIEPVVGWRCFDLVGDRLVSPQQRMAWEPAVKAVADCRKSRWEHNWVQVTTEGRKEMEENAVKNGFTAAEGHYVKFLMPNGEIEVVPVFMPWGMQDFLQPITAYPDPGMDWVLIVHKSGHEPPNEKCHCGIHMAQDLETALAYGSHGTGCFGKVAGWGKSIVGTTGYRVEFAYPQELYFYTKPPSWMAAYEVPMFPVLECEEFVRDGLGITWNG